MLFKRQLYSSTQKDFDSALLNMRCIEHVEAEGQVDASI